MASQCTPPASTNYTISMDATGAGVRVGRFNGHGPLPLVLICVVAGMRVQPALSEGCQAITLLTASGRIRQGHLNHLVREQDVECSTKGPHFSFLRKVNVI